MGQHSGKDKISLEALLRVKRGETPSDDFWNSFEDNLNRRRLSALVERKSVFDFIWNPTLKTAMLAVPVVLLSLTMLWFKVRDDRSVQAADRPSELLLALETADIPEPPMIREAVNEELLSPAGSLASQFVVDAIQPDPEDAISFRKVLYTPALQLSSQSGASYVRDSMSSSTYRVTTAELQLGGNF